MSAPVPRPPGARPGKPAAWARLPEARRRRITLADVRSALAAAEAAPGPPGRPRRAGPQETMPAELPPAGDERPAAVLCLLFEEGEETHVVLTRRSLHLRSHRGEVSFPGGRLGPGELALNAALREAEEEVGVPRGTVEVVGELTPLTTFRSSALVKCFVAIFPGPGVGLRAASAEVERVFSVPLARLAEPGVFHEELWPAPGAAAGASQSRYRAVPFFVLEDDVVWGATGRLLSELLSKVLGWRGQGASAQGSLVK